MFWQCAGATFSRCQCTELPDIAPAILVHPAATPDREAPRTYPMLRQTIVTIVDYCTRHAAQIIGIAVVLGLVTAVYAGRHFAIDADVNKLISKELPWRQREAAFDKSFPPKEEEILAVVDAPTSELATQATAALIQKLSERKDLIHFVMEAGGGPFFQKNGLLFLPTQEVADLTRKLGEGKPVIQALAQDSNLRGLTTALN